MRAGFLAAHSTTDFAKLEQVGSLKLAEAGIAATETVTAAAEAAQTKVAADLQSQVEAVIERGAGESSVAVQKVRAGVADILSDGKVVEAEYGKLRDLLVQYRQSAEAGTQAQQAVVNDLLDLARRNAAVTEGQQAQIKDLLLKVAQLSNRQ